MSPMAEGIFHKVKSIIWPFSASEKLNREEVAQSKPQATKPQPKHQTTSSGNTDKIAASKKAVVSAPAENSGEPSVTLDSQFYQADSDMNWLN